MSQPPGSPADSRGNAGDQLSQARANGRSAAAAFEAIGRCARAEAPQDSLPPAISGDPAQEHARLAGAVCALRHLADRFSRLSFGDAMRAADKEYKLPRIGYGRPAMAARVGMAGEAIGICERSIAAPRRHHRGFWPPDTLSYLYGHARSRGVSLDSIVAGLTTRLLTDLRHYADHQGTDFQQALAAGTRAHAEQRLRAEGPFETGQQHGQLPAAAPLPVTEPFPLTATNQGIVISAADAEWLLIRTAARNQQSRESGLSASPRDADDERVLTEALAAARRQAAEEVFAGLAPQVATRVMQIEDGPARAAGLGREHGRTATPPHCDLEIDGDAGKLLDALGETERTTNSNHGYRLSLVTAYAEAYQQATRHGTPPGGSPAHIAARDFPHPSPTSGTPSAPGPVRWAPASPQAQRHGHRPGAQ